MRFLIVLFQAYATKSDISRQRELVFALKTMFNLFKAGVSCNVQQLWRVGYARDSYIVTTSSYRGFEFLSLLFY